MIPVNVHALASGLELNEREGVLFFSYRQLKKIPWLTHGFSTRIGGVSTGSRAAMNLQFKGDDSDAVRENYRRFGQAVGFPWERAVLSAQTHSVHVRLVTEADAGKGVRCEKDYNDIDGLITDTPGLPILCFSADCSILFLADVRHKAVGLAHSGWRGTVNRMGSHILKAMKEAFGTAPSDVFAAISPSICRDCFEIGPEVAEAFTEAFGKEKASLLLTRGHEDRFHADLWQANRLVLEEAGIPAGRIDLPNVCTRCNPDLLFSHRRTGFDRGTLGAVMMIRDAGL